MRTRKRKPHIALILTVSLAWLILSAGGDVALSAWQPPIGIPEPPFGITTTHTMYADPSYTYDYGSGPEPYRIGPDGPYTHYIDPEHPNATDTDNPYGTHTMPRKTRPNAIHNLPAGSVFEMHSGWQPGVGPIYGSGTASLPIFIRGVAGDEPTFTGVFYINGDYIVMENLKFDLGDYARRTISIGYYEEARTHIAIRGCEFYNGEYDPQSSYMAIRIKYGYDDPNQLKNIVIYNNHFHNIGDGRTTPVKFDASGVSVDANAEDIWIVDNHMHHLGGAGIKVSYDSYKVNTIMPNHIYIGRNIIHDNFEHAIGLKLCEDVIISQNIAYNFGEGYTGTIGHGTSGIPFVDGLGEGPDNVGKYNHWYLFNLAYDYNAADGGFAVYTGAGETLADEIYYIGNIVYNAHNVAGTSTGFCSGGSKRVYWINNTAYNCDRAGFFLGDRVGDAPTEKLTLVNNIFGGMASGSTQPYSLMLGAVQDSLDRMVIKNNVFYNSGGNAQFGVGVYNPPAFSSWATYSTYSAFCTAYLGFCTDSMEANPNHVDAANGDFHLQSNSPAIDAGADVQVYFDRFYDLYGIDISVDFDGNPIIGAPDIGAYESADPDNPTPVLQAIGDKSVDENVTLTFDINASDPDGEPITYSAWYLPSGATFSVQTFNWTPSYTQAGSYQVRFIASDGNSQDSETITITVNNVNRAPVLGPIGNQSVDENALLSFSVNATDPDGQTLTYSISGLPAGAVFASQTFTWTPSYDQAGTHSVTFTADDGQAQDSETITITVINVNQAPVLTAIGNKSAYADVLLTFTIDATDLDGDAITYSAGTLPSGATFTGQDFDWTPSQSQVGSYAVTFIASDGQLQDSETVTMTVDVDSLAPTVTNCSPAAGSIQVPLNNLITLNITDAGIGVEAESVNIKVRINDNPNNYTVYFGDTDHYTSPEGDCRRLGTKADYKFVYQSTNEMFYYDQTVTITVNATDLAGNVMDEYSYSFATEMHSFGQNEQVNSGLDNNDKPVTVCDSGGNIWAAWHAGSIGNRDIYISKLAVDAESFGSTIQLTDNTTDQCNPAVALDSTDKLYVVWQDNREGDWDIYLSTSVDGVNWSTEIRVNDPNEGNQVNPAIVIDNLNYAHVVWQGDPADNNDIFIATSSNGFATKTVSQITTDSFDQIEPAIAADSDNTIYVVWTDGRNGSNDIYGAASNNPWTNVAIVSNANNQSSPAIATESTGSILHFLWVDDTPGNNDIYYASSDGLPGSPLTGSSIIDDSSGADQLDPTIAVTGSTDNNLKVFACWQDWRNTDTDLYFAELSSGSGTNVFVDEGGSNAYQGEPAVGIGEYGHPYIMWADSRSTNTDIYYAGSTFIEPVALASELVTASASSSTTVGTDPQAITTVDDVSIVVPAGACSYDVAITVTKIANLPAFAAPCLGGYDFGPSGIQFSQPVTITIPYVNVSGSATLYWFNSLTGALSQQGITDIQDIPISSSLHALSFKTTHFTAFYLFVGGGTTAAIVGGGGGGGGCSVSASGEGNIVEYILPYIVLAVVMAILKMRDARDRKGT